MCKLEHDVYGPPLADPSGDGENLPNIFAPGKAPVPVSRRPTKFGSLLKVALPILEGGAIGATANSRVSGAGQEAAERFFALQDELALRRQLLKQKTVQDFYQNQLRAAQTQHYLNEPPFARSGGVRYQGISDKDGKLHNYTLNPYTLEAIDRGLAPGPTTRVTPLQTSSGIQSFETAGPEPGKVTPLMTPGTQPESPMEVGEPSVPLQPPEKFVRPIAAVSRDKAGVESTTFFDPREVPLGVPVATRAPKPRIGAAGGGKPLSAAERVAVERWKDTQLTSLEKLYRTSQDGASPMSAADLEGRKQEIQKEYEQQLAAGKPPAAPAGSARSAGGHKIGDRVMFKGQAYVVRGITPRGKLELRPAE